MNEIRRAMIAAGKATSEVLGSSAVERAWGEPSALRGFSVGGLAAHVTTVMASCHRVIDDPDTGDAPIAAEDYYTAFTLTEPENDANRTIVEHGEERARHGHGATADRFKDLLSRLEAKLDELPEERTVLAFGAVPMRLDDFFLTRALEFCVHCDDLAVSVGVDTPEMSDPLALVLPHLLSTARRRHGDLPVLRAFTRRERDELEALRLF